MKTSSTQGCKAAIQPRIGEAILCASAPLREVFLLFLHFYLENVRIDAVQLKRQSYIL
jgi:hypothetical protein